MADENWRQQRAQELWGDSEPWFIRESRRRVWSSQDDGDEAHPPAQQAPDTQERQVRSLKLVRDEPPVDPVPDDLGGGEPQPIASPANEDWRMLRDRARRDDAAVVPMMAPALVDDSRDEWRARLVRPADVANDATASDLPPIEPEAIAPLRPMVGPAAPRRAMRGWWIAAAVLILIAVLAMRWAFGGSSAPVLVAAPAVEPRPVIVPKVVVEAPPRVAQPAAEVVAPAPVQSQPEATELPAERVPAPAAPAARTNPSSATPIEPVPARARTEQRESPATRNVAPVTTAPAKVSATRSSTERKPVAAPVVAKQTASRSTNNAVERNRTPARTAVPARSEETVQRRPEPRTIIIPPAEPVRDARANDDRFPAPSERAMTRAEDSAETAKLNTEQADVAALADSGEPAPRPRRRFWDTTRLPRCTGYQVYRPTTPCRATPNSWTPRGGRAG